MCQLHCGKSSARSVNRSPVSRAILPHCARDTLFARGRLYPCVFTRFTSKVCWTVFGAANHCTHIYTSLRSLIFSIFFQTTSLIFSTSFILFPYYLSSTSHSLMNPFRLIQSSSPELLIVFTSLTFSPHHLLWLNHLLILTSHIRLFNLTDFLHLIHLDDHILFKREWIVSYSIQWK